MNEAVVTFICTDSNGVPYTKVMRIEFEGSPEQFLDALNSSRRDAAFSVVASEVLRIS